MADLEQTPLGWRTIAPDGSEIHLPDEVAMEAFPDFFAKPEQPAEEQPLGAAPSLGVPQLEQPVVDQPQVSAPQPTLQDNLSTGQLPPGISGASYSQSGYRPKTRPDRLGLIDVQSTGQPFEAAGALVNQTFGQKEKGELAMAEAQMAADEAIQPFYGQREELLVQAQKEEAARAEQARAELMAHDERIQAEIAAIPQENPGRHWHNESSFDSGMSTLTMILGGMQAMKTGGANQVAQFALELTDRDMRAQEQEIATAKAKVGFAESAYDRKSKQNYYDKLDLQESKALKLETLAASMEKEAAKYKSQFTQAKFLQAVAGIRVERDKILVDVTQARSAAMQQAAMHNNQMRQQMADRAQRERHFSERLSFDKDQAKAAAAEKGVATPTLIGTSTGFSLGGKEFVSPGAKVEHQFDNQKVIAQKGLDGKKAYIAAERMKSMIANGSWFDPEFRGEVKQLAADITMGSVALSGQSISKSSDKDMQMLQSVSMGNDPLSAYTAVYGKAFSENDAGGVGKRLQLFQDNVRKAETEFIQSYGGQYANAIWDPGAIETEKAGGVTDSGMAREKLGQLKYGDPNIAKGELVPATGGTYAPRDVRAGQLDPNTVEFKAHAERGKNPEYDNVGAAKSYAETILKEVKSGKMSPEQAGAAAIELYEAARNMAPHYPTDARAIESAADYLLTNITKQAGKSTRETLPSTPTIRSPY